MDAYMEQLELAASAPDDAFPEMLFEPLTNDFGDYYFNINVEDYGSTAVLEDPRFTRDNIFAIRGSVKRPDDYLCQVSLYDDYMDYLKRKYGSVEMAVELADHLMIMDPMPAVFHRPILRKGKYRKLLEAGIIPSTRARGISDPEACWDHIADVCNEIAKQMPPMEEPDASVRVKPSKHFQKIMKKNAEKYKAHERYNTLINGTRISGLSSNMDFVDNYYVNYDKGVYDTQFSDKRHPYALVPIAEEAENKKYWHLGQVAAAEDAQQSQYLYDGSMIRDKKSKDLATVQMHLVKYAGVNLIDKMNDAGMSKSAIKAAISGMASVGMSIPLTEKQKKKQRKKQAKLARMSNSSLAGEQRLADILLNNKIMLNGGTVRFEDGMRRRHD